MIKIVLFVVLIAGASCNQRGSKSKQANSGYDILFTNKVNINEVIKDSLSKKNLIKYRVFPKLIKAGILISTIRRDEEADKNDYYFLIYNLNEKRIEWLVHNPFKELSFHEIEYDYDSNKIFAYSHNGMKQLSYYECNTMKTGTMSFSEQNLGFDPGSMLINKNLIFFTQSPLGALVYDIEQEKSISFRNNHANTISYVYSTVATPFSDSLNLISGKREGSKVFAYTVDSAFQIKDSFQFKEDNYASDGYFKMLALKDRYAIFNRREAALFNKKHLDLIWVLNYKKSLQNAFILSEQNLLCVVSDSGKTSLLGIEVKKGNVAWEREFPIRVMQNQSIAINKRNNRIIVAGVDSIWQLNYFGHRTAAISAPGNKWFQVFEDPLNDDNYIFVDDKTFYW